MLPLALSSPFFLLLCLCLSDCHSQPDNCKPWTQGLWPNAWTTDPHRYLRPLSSRVGVITPPHYPGEKWSSEGVVPKATSVQVVKLESKPESIWQQFVETIISDFTHQPEPIFNHENLSTIKEFHSEKICFKGGFCDIYLKLLRESWKHFKFKDIIS